MEKTKIKKYIVYFAGFFGGVLFFISVPIVVVYLFTLGSEKPVFVGIPPLITIVVIYGVAYFIALKKGKTVFKITYSSLIFSIIAILCFLIITNVPINKHGESYLDSRRIGDLKQLQLALDFYYDENNRYPVAEAGCRDTSSLEVLPPLGFIYEVPQERFTEGHPSYQYAVSSDGSQYVLWTKFEDEEQSALSNQTLDLDGIVLGCDCNDPNFCVGSDNFSN